MKKVPMFFAVAVAALAAGAFFYKGRHPTPPVQSSSVPAPNETADPIPPVVPPPAPQGEGAPDKPRRSATVYRVAPGDEHARLVPVEVPLPEGEEPMAAALNAMARIKDSPLPPGTQARPVTMNGDGVALVDFNDAFQSNFPGGDEAEALTINAVLSTLAHFVGVERVQITVDGKKIDSIGGNQELTKPLPVRGETQATWSEAAHTARNDAP